MSPGGSLHAVPGRAPLIGRDDELSRLAGATQADPLRGFAIVGAEGIGKSRLAGEVMARAQAEGWAVERIDGQTAAPGVPLSAVAHLVATEIVKEGDPLQLLLAATEAVTRRAAKRKLVVLVDDADLLDEASLAWVRRISSHPRLFLLLAMRSGGSVPEPIARLWQEGLVDRLDLGPLSQAATQQLLERWAPDVDDPVARDLRALSGGNPFYLRELISAGFGHAARTGTGLRDDQDGTDRRLIELIERRMGSLSPAARQATQLLAIVGGLSPGVLQSFVPAEQYVRLVDEGVVSVHEGGAEPVVTLGHPIYRVVAEAGLSADMARRLRSGLLERMEKLDADGLLTARDQVRLALLGLGLGFGVAPEQLLAAERHARAAFARSLAQRLTADPRAGGLAAAPTQAWTTAGGDELVMAERLAQEAWEASRDITAGLELSAVRVARQDAPGAERVLDELHERVAMGSERVRLDIARAELAFWVRDDASAAEQILESSERTAADPATLSRLRRFRAGIALNQGEVVASVGVADRILSDAGPAGQSPETVMAAATLAAGQALLGHLPPAIELIDRYLPEALARLDEVPEVVGQLMVARVFAARAQGEVATAERLAHLSYQAAVDGSSPAAMAVFVGALGQVALDQGRPRLAARRFREAELLLRDFDSFGYRPWVLAGLVVALAQQGDAAAANEMYRSAQAARRPVRYFEPEVILAGAWAHLADGRKDQAIQQALAAAELAHTNGLAPFEAAALHTAARFGEVAGAAERLAELASLVDSAMLRAWADHSMALAAGDATGLIDTVAAFDGMGLRLLAAEAAAQAVVSGQDAGRVSLVFTAETKLSGLLAGLEARGSPTLRLAQRPSLLTPREHEVAMLAATGLTSPDIAQRLVVSPRTVESHLQRVFTKLGISSRQELAGLVG